jgi:hypothetical protein
MKMHAYQRKGVELIRASCKRLIRKVDVRPAVGVFLDRETKAAPPLYGFETIRFQKG